MNHLASALKDYYTKRDGKIIFINNCSLNRLALLMWEELHFSQIDASVLSKVINGKRLFTNTQLEAFCKVLDIPSKEKSYLFYCLNQDYCDRYNISLDDYFLSKDSVLELLRKCLNEMVQTKPIFDTQLPQIIESFTKNITDTSMNSVYEKNVFEVLGTSLFFKAKRLINFKHGSLYIADDGTLARVYASSPVLYKVFPRQTGTTMSVYKQQRTFTFPADYILNFHPELNQLSIGSDLVIPLIYKQKTFGVLSMLSDKDTTFTKKDITTLQNYL